MAVPSPALRPHDTFAAERAVTVEEACIDRPRLRFPFLDGMRALAALAVVVLHAFQIFGLGLGYAGVADGRGGLGFGAVERGIVALYDVVARRGALAVPVFIVISGYSLMLPVARASGRLEGGARAFFKRRMRRILPPYYAALALSLLLIALVPGMNAPAGVYWDFALPGLEPRAIVAHMLFLHNGEGYWGAFHQINPPLWSIGVEEQIYLLFPLLALLWRTWGGRFALAIAIAYGLLPLYLPLQLLPLSHSWYVGLFALGMLAAHVGLAPQATLPRWCRRMRWGMVTVLSLPALGGWMLLQQVVATGAVGSILRSRWIEDSLLGVTICCLLTFCTKLSMTPHARRSLVFRALETPTLAHVGRFSYSIYLLHAPILALVALLCRGLGLPVVASYLVVLAAGIPLVVLGAYLFFLVFERPFLSGYAQQAEQRQVVAAG